LVLKHHPDKLSQDLNEEEMDAAKKNWLKL